jgi:TatA/E family protein of Tat protein translocase
MFDIGGAEFLVIGLAVLLLFGPKKIPEVMRSVGKGLRYFRQAQEDFRNQIRDISAEVEKQTNLDQTNKIIDTSAAAQPEEKSTDTVAPATEKVVIRPAEGPIVAARTGRTEHSVQPSGPELSHNEEKGNEYQSGDDPAPLFPSKPDTIQGV